VDAYIFVSGAAEQTFLNAEALVKQRDSGVRLSLKLVGPWDLLVFAEVEEGDLARLGQISLFELRAPGSTSTDTAINVHDGPGTERIKRSTFYPFEAFVRIAVSDGIDPDAVLEEVSKVSGYYASAVVEGSFPALAEIGAESFPELLAAVRAVRAIRGVSSETAACFARFEPHDISGRPALR
jgi:hypothetical protein